MRYLDLFLTLGIDSLPPPALPAKEGYAGRFILISSPQGIVRISSLVNPFGQRKPHCLMEKKIKVIVDSSDSEYSQSQTSLLKKWVNDEDRDDLIVTQSRKPLQPNEAGGLLESVLYITLNSAAIVVLAKSLATWFKTRADVANARSKQLKVTVETASGDKITIDTSNAGETEQDIIHALAEVLKK